MAYIPQCAVTNSIKVVFRFELGFFVSVLVHRRLTKPIQRLIDNFENMAPHSPTTMRMLPYKGKDEIEKLVIGNNAWVTSFVQCGKGLTGTNPNARK